MTNEIIDALEVGGTIEEVFGITQTQVDQGMALFDRLNIGLYLDWAENLGLAEDAAEALAISQGRIFGSVTMTGPDSYTAGSEVTIEIKADFLARLETKLRITNAVFTDNLRVMEEDFTFDDSGVASVTFKVPKKKEWTKLTYGIDGVIFGPFDIT